MNLLFDDGKSQRNANEIYLPSGISTVKIPGIALPETALVIDFSVSRKEIVDAMKCFNDNVHVYAFGDDPSSSVARLGLILLLGRKCGSSNSSGYSDLMKLTSSYEKNRVYNKMDAISVSVGTFVFSGYLSSMQIGSVDARDMTCPVVFTFSVLGHA